MYRSLLNLFLQKCGAYLGGGGGALKTVVIPLSTVSVREEALLRLLNFLQMRRLFEGDAYLSNYSNL